MTINNQGEDIFSHQQLVQSHDWDEVGDFCNRVYMPYNVRPVGQFFRPRATLISRNIRDIILTKFSYGVPIVLDNFSQDAGKVLVLTTLRGKINHNMTKDEFITTSSMYSFAADCSRVDYMLEADCDHLQINLTIPHDLLHDFFVKMFGTLPKQDFWQTKFKFGGENSSWINLLRYISGLYNEDTRFNNIIDKHVEENLCFELLRNWVQHSPIENAPEFRGPVPQYIRIAEQYITENAANVPTMSEIAINANTSVRSLNHGFRKFLGINPSEFLREQRLKGVHQALISAKNSETVASIASEWGFVNFGNFSLLYKKRFGELPSHTLRNK